MCGPVYLTQMKRKAVIVRFCWWWWWLLVVMAVDPFWTPFLDPIIGPHFWIPFLDAILDPILESAETWPPEGHPGRSGPPAI